MAEGTPVDVPMRYPLTAMVGCDELVDALTCALCSRRIRTVLVIGPAGTGKSVAVRAATALSGRSAIELPLNATAEQIFGTIDMDIAMTEGRRTVTDSLMRRADGNLLIADNINLLPRSLLHSVLDTVTTGIVRAELDGTSVDERCDTVLLATMDPAEAELSPHEMDRFDICVGTRTLESREDRQTVLERNLGFERDPAGFIGRFESSENTLRDKIASSDPDSVSIPDDVASLIPEISAAMGVEGHRGDVATAEVARALASMDGAAEVCPEHFRKAVGLCLAHRLQRGWCDRADEPLRDIVETEETADEPVRTDRPEPSDDTFDVPTRDDRAARVTTSAVPAVQEDVVFGIGSTFRVTDFIPQGRMMARDRNSGRRGLSLSEDSTGRCIGYVMPRGRPRDIALGATIRMAAPHQPLRSRDGVAISIEDDDIREKVRVRRRGTKILFVVDGSGSMGAEGRMVAVKGGDSASSLTGSYIYTSDTQGTYEAGKSGFLYSFELPDRESDEYLVTVGIDNPWAQYGTKYEDIIIEDQMVEENL